MKRSGERLEFVDATFGLLTLTVESGISLTLDLGALIWQDIGVAIPHSEPVLIHRGEATIGGTSFSEKRTGAMNLANNASHQIKYPYPLQVLAKQILLLCIFWGIPVLTKIVKVNTRYSPYQNGLILNIADVGAFLMGVLILQGFIVVLTNWKNHMLIFDKEGIHGLNGISMIPWSEISSIGNITTRYNILGKPSNFLAFRVKSLDKIIWRERGYIGWRLRRMSGNSRDIVTTNVPKKDILTALNGIQDMFSQEIRVHHIRIIPSGDLSGY